LFALKERVAVVTGGAAGLGRGIAGALADAGAAVVVADRDEEGATETVREIVAAGGRGSSFVADMGNPDAIAALFRYVETTYGRLDVLVNAAAISAKAPAEDISVEAWDQALRINATAYLLTAQKAFRLFRAAGRGGSIINISSIAGWNALGRDSIAYSVSKAAINQMTRELAVEWGTYGIRVNAIMPCQFVSPSLNQYRSTPAGKDITQKWIAGIPLGRLGEPEDIVGPVLFLASSASAMVTGHLLAVDGGNLAVNVSGTIRVDRSD
jgi:NAD(P)-dependent dehydrogenase (short-subunit alcohol dehydrogenase family)